MYTCKYSIAPVTVCMRYLPVHLYNCRVSTAQGKQGKWPNKFPVRENTGNLEILPKQGLVFAQVVNSLLLKTQYVMIFVVKFSKSVVHIKLHKFMRLA